MAVQIPNLVPVDSLTNADLCVTRQSSVDKNYSLLVMKRFLGVPDVGITPYMKTVLDDATEITARTTLGVIRADSAEAIDGESQTLTMSPATTKEAIFTHAVPAGSPVPWPTSTAPSGWIECNGGAFDTVLYPNLALAYPSGDLPDLRGEFIRGWDHGRGVDAGRTVYSPQVDEFKSHSHTQDGRTPLVSPNTGTSDPTSGSPSGSRGGTTLETGGVETRPRNISFMYIVRLA